MNLRLAGESVKALVLAAGEGTRLRPLTLECPKPMVSIAGRPMLEHTLALLRSHGIRDIAVNLHYKPDVVTDYFAKFPSLNLLFSYEDPILGTAGAAKKLAGFLDSTFVLIYGDVLTDIDLSTLIAYDRLHGALLTMVVYRVEDPTRCGIVEMDITGRVRSFVEKPVNPVSNLANAGIYVVHPSLLELVPDGFADFGFDVIPKVLSAGFPIYAWPIDPGAYLLDIGSLERYERACADALAGHIRLLRLDSENSF